MYKFLFECMSESIIVVFAEKEKPTKVKIEGRQRLRKVRDNDSDDKRVVLDEPNFIDIADFDSPLKVKI